MKFFHFNINIRRLVLPTVLWSILLTGAVDALGAPTELTIHSDFPGGSVTVESIDQQARTLRVLPAHHQDRGWDCWWYFKVEGIVPGETLTLDVGGGVWATPDQCFYSVDNSTWMQLPRGNRTVKNRIAFQAKVNSSTAWFAWGPPFVPTDAAALVKSAAASSPWATEFELCQTRAGRSTPALRVRETGTPDNERLRIWVQARQHAWESGSSWVCQGFVKWLISDDPAAVRLRKSTEIVIVPIMDIDNVTLGAGGKNEVPQDHNRDWTDHPHWRSVEAAQQEILKMNAEDRFALFVDLHNPSAGDREPYFYTAPHQILSEVGKRRLDTFLEAARTEMTAPLAFRGKTIESGASYDKNWQAISKNWVMQRCNPHAVALTLETAWNTPDSTPEGYQHVGHGLGRTIGRYCELLQGKP